MKYQRKGIVLVLVAVCMFVLLGFAVLVIDVGVMYNARADLQRTADAAAMAGASVYTTDDMMRVRLDQESIEPIISEAIDRSSNIGSLNPTFGSATMNIGTSDITPGWINLNSASEIIHNNPAPKDYNAVQVITRRDDTENGEVSLFFAGIFGKSSVGVNAMAVAALDDRFAGVNMSSPNGASILPFTMHEDTYNLEMTRGGDNYTYDSGTVSSGPDLINEIRLFPYPLSGGGTEGDGNFGFLNIGNPSESANVEREQIEGGITEEQVLDELGTSDLAFYDENGDPVTYVVGGSPGLEATMEKTIQARIGDTIGFFLHNDYIKSGANISYTITKLVYGVIMDVKLTGSIKDKYFYIQVISYVGNDIIIDEDAPSSNGLIGRIVLVR